MRRTSGRLCTEDMWMEAPSAGHPGGGTAGAGLGSWAPASPGPAAGSRAPAPSRCSRRRLHADRRPTCRTQKLPLRAAFQVSAPCQSEPGTKRLGGLAPTRPELRRGPRLPRPPQAAFCVACFASGDAGARHAAGNRAARSSRPGPGTAAARSRPPPASPPPPLPPHFSSGPHAAVTHPERRSYRRVSNTPARCRKRCEDDFPALRGAVVPAPNAVPRSPRFSTAKNSDSENEGSVWNAMKRDNL